MEGLLSNNLRMSLTGSEINHPDKAYDTLFSTLKDSKKVSNYVDFSKETGIKVNYSTYSSNEELLAKVSSAKEGTYDLIFPSDYMIEIMKTRNLLDVLDLTKLSNKEKIAYLNSYLGFVFQEYNILKDLTLIENISLPLEIQGVKRKERKQNAKVDGRIGFRYQCRSWLWPCNRTLYAFADLPVRSCCSPD